MDGIGDVAGGCGVDCRAVDEEAFFGIWVCEGDWGKRRMKDRVEEIFDMRGFWKCCYDYFL